MSVPVHAGVSGGKARARMFPKQWLVLSPFEVGLALPRVPALNRARLATLSLAWWGLDGLSPRLVWCLLFLSSLPHTLPGLWTEPQSMFLPIQLGSLAHQSRCKLELEMMISTEPTLGIRSSYWFLPERSAFRKFQEFIWRLHLIWWRLVPKCV